MPDTPGSPQSNPSPGGGGNPGTADRQTADRGGRGGERFLEPGDEYAGGPLTGGNYRNWSDRLRDVEEMLDDPELRTDVASVRDRAREIRIQVKRHGQKPQWDVVQMEVAGPLKALNRRISQELAKLQSDQAPVPIDRDPVPGRFKELVRIYYENLGGGD